MTVITRVYDDYEAARTAQNNVNALGLPGVEVSILGNESIRQHHEAEIRRDPVTGRPDTVAVDPDGSGMATGAGIGATIGGGAGLLAGLGMLAIPGVGPLVAAGWLAATAVGAAGGALAGGTVGAIVDLGLAEEDVPVFSEAIRRGSVAVSVKCGESDRPAVEAALGQLSTTSLIDRRARYEAEGWRINETAEEREARLRGTAPIDPPNRVF